MVEGICGPMYSGKSSELLRRVERARYAKMKTLLVKPTIDTRYHAGAVSSHSGRFEAALVVTPNDAGVHEIADRVGKYDLVAVDEVQFFPRSIVAALQQLSDHGAAALWAGLDMDYEGRPFGPVPYLMAVGGVTKLTAVCTTCGEDAIHTHRIKGGNDLVEVGAAEQYTALCRRCWLRERQ